jgi:quercetin dioxygenase-like cupin family protein
MRVDTRFDRRHFVLGPGDRRPYDPADWEDALVTVEHGEIDVECRAGGRIRVVAGDMLWFTGLPVRWLSNPGPEPAVLVAVTRGG